MYYLQVLSVPLLYNEGIVNIQVLCSIPLAWTWRYCQWYWQCLHIQTKGALITCINHCHLLELTLLCLVDLWKLDESISKFKGAWCTCMQRVKILILGVWSGPALFAYVHFHRTLCTSRPWSYYRTVMNRLSNVREILQFHYCNVTLYTEKETLLQGQNRAACFVSTAHFFFFIFIYIYIKIWASSWENVSSGVSNQVRLKLACSATEAS